MTPALHSKAGAAGVAFHPDLIFGGADVSSATGSALGVCSKPQFALYAELQISQQTVRALHRSILCLLKPPCMFEPSQAALIFVLNASSGACHPASIDQKSKTSVRAASDPELWGSNSSSKSGTDYAGGGN